MTWTCVQALAGMNGEAAEAAERKMDSAGSVPVVCTPRGEAQSIRLTLESDWLESLTDEQLARAIVEAKDR